MKEFFISFFHKAAQKEVKIILPTDFICAHKVDLDESIKQEVDALEGTHKTEKTN